MNAPGKIAIVTGAGSGIGRAAAVTLLRNGYTVVLAGRRPEALEATVQEAGAPAGRTLVVPTNITEQASVQNLFAQTAESFGRERANLVFGWIFAGHQIGAATAAFAAGLSRTELASYLPAFFAAGVLCLVAAVLALTIGRARTNRVAATQAA